MRRFTKMALSAMALSMGLFACTPSADTTSTKASETAAQESTVETSGETEAASTGELPNIGVIQLMEHTSLNIIYDSFIAELEALGYGDKVGANIDFKNAQGDMANITSIVQTFEGSKPDIVVAITTPVAQGAMSLTKDMPVVFSAVTDPISAGVVTDLETTDKGMTGTSDAIQVEKILDLALEITPDIKTVGYIYNPGEDNSVSNLAKAKAYLTDKGIAFEEASISTSSDLQTAASALVEKVDAIFVANDNTVASAMPALMQVANAAKVPVYVGADSMVMDGGFATVGIDYTDLGKETARMVVDILNGKSVSEIPVKVFKDDLYIYVNQKTLAELGITLPESITSDAKYVKIDE